MEWIERYRGYRIVKMNTLRALYLAVTYNWRPKWESRKGVRYVPDFPKFHARKSPDGKYYGSIVIGDRRFDYGPFDRYSEALKHVEELAFKEWRRNPYVLVKRGKKVIGRKHWVEWHANH